MRQKVSSGPKIGSTQFGTDLRPAEAPQAAGQPGQSGRRIRSARMHVASPEVSPSAPLVRTFFFHALNRRLLIWLLAFALPVQAAACATAAVRGPAHVHQRAAGAVALEDFRRAPPHGVFLDRRVAPDLGHAHVHAFDLPQRHPHARFDPSVVKLGGGADAAIADENAAPASSAAAFVAVLPAPPPWHAGPRASFPAPGRDARFFSLPPAPPEKPPRAVV